MVAGYQAWAGKVQASNLAAHSPGQALLSKDVGERPVAVRCQVEPGAVGRVEHRREHPGDHGVLIVHRRRRDPANVLPTSAAAAPLLRRCRGGDREIRRSDAPGR